MARAVKEYQLHTTADKMHMYVWPFGKSDTSFFTKPTTATAATFFYLGKRQRSSRTPNVRQLRIQFIKPIQLKTNFLHKPRDERSAMEPASVFQTRKQHLRMSTIRNSVLYFSIKDIVVELIEAVNKRFQLMSCNPHSFRWLGREQILATSLTLITPNEMLVLKIPIFGSEICVFVNQNKNTNGN